MPVRFLSKAIRQKSHQKISETILVPGGYFPDDLDTTSLALTTLPPNKSEDITSVLDKMIEFVNPDGTVQVSLASRM